MKILAVIVILLLLSATVAANNCYFYEPKVFFANCYWGGGLKWCYWETQYRNYRLLSPHKPELMGYQDPNYGWTNAVAYGDWVHDSTYGSAQDFKQTGYTYRGDDGVNAPLKFRYRWYCPDTTQWYEKLITSPQLFSWCPSIGMCATGI